MTTPHTPPPVHPPSAPVPPHVAPAPPAKRGEGLAIASMVLGIVSIVGFMGFLLGIPAIVLGVIALKKGTGDKGMSITGIVTGAIATLISLLFIAFMVFVFMMAAAEESNSHSSPQDNRPNYSYPRSSSSSEL